MALNFFDTHCDTASEIRHRRESIVNNSCHISLDNVKSYDKYAQCFAIWSESRLPESECFDNFISVSDYFFDQIEKNSDRIQQIKFADELDTALDSGKTAAILAVEDARLLNNDISRLEVLYERGVRYLTLLWGGVSCIGGSHNTNQGLTDFGKAVAAGCFELGIIPDVSHASVESVDDFLPIAYKYGKPFIASHSNPYSCHAHTRNIQDRHFKALKELGGIAGINFCAPFIVAGRQPTADDVVRHIDRYMELGGENFVGFGADWDGIDCLPVGMNHAGDMQVIADALAAHGYSKELIDKLFFDNFHAFFEKNLPVK